MNTQSMVYIVDDDAGVRRSLGWMLSTHHLQFTTFESGTAFLDEAIVDCPSCVILDMHLPGPDGIEVLRKIKETPALAMPAIILTGSSAVSEAVESMKLGAREFLEKPVDHKILLEKVRECLAMDAEHRASTKRQAALKSRADKLTDREKEVLRLLCEGKSSKEMAAKLNISVKTVSIHRWHLMKKMQVGSATEAVRVAYDAHAA
jgi:two-component system response regulator FixJ